MWKVCAVFILNMALLYPTASVTFSNVPGLQITTVELDGRVTILEENSGDGGNSSVAELEMRVETLEGTAANHESRISATELDINGKTSSTFDRKGIEFVT